MKTIGLLGGMSWESTIGYYRAINQGVKQALGGLHSAKIAMYSIDFAELEKMQHAGDWQGAAEILITAARKIENAGADALLICTNTMHKVATEVANAIHIPLLHIADATAQELHRHNIQSVGLLGTAFTMEQEFYKGRLQHEHQLKVLVPDEDDRKTVHRIIYQELCQGTILPASQQAYLQIITKLADAGAEAVILGCTEIGMLIQQKDTNITLFDTTTIHAAKAVEFALAE
ncbi:Aspartate racemase [Thalassocella blandensis]|nr:Aspartate racemase [Thalassocella blandensis]